MIHPKCKKNIVTTSSKQGSPVWQQQIEKVMEEYKDFFSSPVGVSLHCQVKHSIDLTLATPLPNGTIYRHSIIKNDEIKRKI